MNLLDIQFRTSGTIRTNITWLGRVELGAIENLVGFCEAYRKKVGTSWKVQLVPGTVLAHYSEIRPKKGVIILKKAL